MMNKMDSITEPVKGACEILCEDHEWIPQNSVVLPENQVLKSLNFDIEVPCVVQWEMFWYFSPTILINDLLNDGVFHEQYNKSGQYGHRWVHYLSLLEKRQPKNMLLTLTKSGDAPLRDKMGLETGKGDEWLETGWKTCSTAWG